MPIQETIKSFTEIHPFISVGIMLGYYMLFAYVIGNFIGKEN